MDEVSFDALFESDAAAPEATAEVAEESPAEEVPAEETPAEDVPAEEEEAAPVVEEEEAPAEEAPAEDSTLPEGVTVNEKGGKKFWTYPEERGRTIYDGFQRARAAEEVLGEPLTVDALQERQSAYDWKQSLRADFLSPNPEEQKDAFFNLIRDASFAIKDGEIGHDPALTAGEAMLETLKTHCPEGFERASKVVMNDQIEKLYRKGRDGDSRALKMAQNLDHAFNGKFLKDDQVAAMKDPDPREQSLLQREQALEQRARQEREQGIQNWWADTRAKIGSQVDSVVDETIKPIEESLKAFPDRAKNIKTLLHTEVKSAIQADSRWREQTATLKRNAERAPSEAKRLEFQQQLEKRYAAKARIVLATVAPKILDAEIKSAREKVTATQTRVQAGSKNREPQGAASPAARTLPGSGSNGPLDRQSFAKELDAMFR